MLNKRILVLMFVVSFLLLVGCRPPPTIPNREPIITSDPITTATVGEAYTYDVNATDPDGDTLTYSLAAPPGMTINSGTGLISWTPAAKGDYDILVMVSDGALHIPQSFTIVVSEPLVPPVPPINHAPTINSIPVTIATVGVTYFYGVNATDPDNDVLTYYLTTCPPGMTIDYASGLIMWTPTAEGNYAVVVEVFDGDLSDTQSFPITVSKPSVPVKIYTITASAGTGGTISPLGDISVNKGTNISFNITPNTNYNIADVLVDGGSVGAVVFYTFTNVAKDHAIYAAFSASVLPSNNANLSALAVTPGVLVPNFLATTIEYNVGVVHDIATISVTATLADTKASMTIDGTAGVAKIVTLGPAGTVTKINIKVTAEDGTTTKVYTITVNRAKSPAELDNLRHSLEADFKPEFAPGVYEYSLVATYDEDAITLTATTYLEGATIEYNYEYTNRTTVEEGFGLLVSGKNIITITVESDGYQTTTYTITVTREGKLPVHNVNIDKYYRTIQAAITDASDGHTIYVAAGTYPVVVAVNKSVNLFGANAGVCAGTDSSARWAESTVDAFKISVDDVTIDGFQIDGADISADILNAIVLVGDTSGHTIYNNILPGPSGTGTPIGGTRGIVFGSGVSDTTVVCNEIYGWMSGIYINPCSVDSNLLFQYNDIHHNWAGIGSGPNINDVSILNNNFSHNVEGFGSSTVGEDVEVHSNNFIANLAGVNWYGPDIGNNIDATDNWWGNASGPTHTNNPGGTGDTVSDNVDFDPWSPSPN